MIWQDIVFMTGGFMFSIFLIPTIMAPSHSKPPVKSSLSTAIMLMAYEICFISLGLWLSAIANILTVVAWLIIAIQKYRQNKIEEKV